MDINAHREVKFGPFPSSERGKITVITGGRGIGKTTYCSQVIEAARKAGLSVRGLLSPGRFSEGKKNGIFLTDLGSGETRLLASSLPQEIEGLSFGYWVFDQKVLEWGNQCLIQSKGADILIIDELGYLEFNLKVGLISSFDLLRGQDYGMAMVIIRPELLKDFSDKGFIYQLLDLQDLNKPVS
jgi:nucleoside-triphosphatase